MNYTDKSYRYIDATPIFTAEFLKIFRHVADLDDDQFYTEADHMTINKPVVYCRSSTEPQPHGDYYELVIDTSWSVKLKYVYYSYPYEEKIKFRLTRDTFIRMLDRRAQPTWVLTVAEFDNFYSRDMMRGMNPFIALIEDQNTVQKKIDTWAETTIRQKFIEFGISDERLKEMEQSHMQCTVMITAGAPPSIDAAVTAKCVCYHLTITGKYCGYRSMDSSYLNCFYGFTRRFTTSEGQSRYLSGSNMTGNASWLWNQIGKLPVRENVVELISKLSGASYDPSKHNEKTLDDYLAYERGVVRNQQEQITLIDKSIPSTSLSGRTIMDTIQSTGQDVLSSAKLYVDERLKLVINDINNSIASLTTKVNQVNNTFTENYDKTSRGLVDEVNTRVNQINLLKNDVDNAIKKVNEFSRKVDKITDVDLEQLNEKIATIEKILENDFPSLESLLDGFNLQVQKMFGANKITRRQGYFDMPSLGMFENGVALITNEGDILVEGMSTRVVTKKNLPKLLVENFTMDISLTPSSDGWCVYISDTPFDIFGLETTIFKTVIGYLTK